jgi:hypothetical protein
MPGKHGFAVYGVDDRLRKRRRSSKEDTVNKRGR